VRFWNRLPLRCQKNPENILYLCSVSAGLLHTLSLKFPDRSFGACVLMGMPSMWCAEFGASSQNGSSRAKSATLLHVLTPQLPVQLGFMRKREASLLIGNPNVQMEVHPQS